MTPKKKYYDQKSFQMRSSPYKNLDNLSKKRGRGHNIRKESLFTWQAD